ncbi:hypothetical protein OBV_38480 [Oscillibacter valericigenes Sjm18-20]|nr:hypothetical protein OBV_38480 [Oscillibacter valericigenes Sjm18-20]
MPNAQFLTVLTVTLHKGEWREVSQRAPPACRAGSRRKSLRLSPFPDLHGHRENGRKLRDLERREIAMEGMSWSANLIC